LKAICGAPVASPCSDHHHNHGDHHDHGHHDDRDHQHHQDHQDHQDHQHHRDPTTTAATTALCNGHHVFRSG
jgi:hypothetical protein